MTEDEAQEVAAIITEALFTFRGLYTALREHGEYPAADDILDALNTIAHMHTEEDHHFVDPFTNGGAYQPRRHTRHVTEWSAE